MLGLKKGRVKLIPHQEEWADNAQATIAVLARLLGNAAVDIQHIGSTAIPAIYAKPIIDLVVGVRDLNDIQPYMRLLSKHRFVYRGEDVEGQLLFVAGDFEKDIITHHIHIAIRNGAAWNNYLTFRDYLNAFPEKAMLYDSCKRKLAAQYSCDRKSYTEGKREVIDNLLKEATVWKSQCWRSNCNLPKNRLRLK